MIPEVIARYFDKLKDPVKSFTRIEALKYREE